MRTKILEVRDSATRITVLAIRFDPADETEFAMFSQNGYGHDINTQSRYVAVMRIDGGNLEAKLDPYHWDGGTRTMPLAHQFIATHFDELETGDVVDVEFELGWKPDKKLAEWRSYL